MCLILKILLSSSKHVYRARKRGAESLYGLNCNHVAENPGYSFVPFFELVNLLKVLYGALLPAETRAGYYHSDLSAAFRAEIITLHANLISSSLIVSGGAMRIDESLKRNQSMMIPCSIQRSITFFTWA